jgi:hypothetical protein
MTPFEINDGTSSEDDLPSETSCPSGWAETSAVSDNLGARIRNYRLFAHEIDFDVAAPIDPKDTSIKPATLVSAPAPHRKHQLDDLLARMKPEHRHGETDWGDRRGKEIW